MIRLFTLLPCWVVLGFLGMAAQAAKPEGAAQAEELKTRTFHKVPPDFVVVRDWEEPAGIVADPFAPPPRRKRKPGEPAPLIKTARDQLVDAGITFPEGASASFDSYSGTLTVVNTQANLELFEAYMDSGCNLRPHHVSFVLTVIEGPAEVIRAANAAVAQEDAAQVLAGLMEQAAKAETHVRVVQDAYLETKSGLRATTRSVQEHVFPVVSLDDQSHLSSVQERQMMGLSFEMEPVIAADGDHISLNYVLELSPAPLRERKMTSADPATGNPVEFPAVVVPMARLSADTSVQTGSTRLLGVVSPYDKAGAERREVQWAAFLSTHIVRMENLRRTRPEVKAAALQVPPGMQKLALPVPSGLLENKCMEAGQSLQPYLDTNGVAPAAGAQAVVEQEVLTVVNTPENLERIVALVDYLTVKLPKTVALTLHTVRGSGAFLRSIAAQAATRSDHDAQWLQVQQALQAGSHGLRLVGTSRMETATDKRASLEAIQEYLSLTQYAPDKAGKLVPQFETNRAGSILEFEPTVSYHNDGLDLMLSHEFHPLPPEAGRVDMLSPGSKKRQSFPIQHAHAQQTVTGWHMKNGSTQLLSLLKPPGEAAAAGDELIATFLRCDVMPQSTRKKDSAPTLAQMLASVRKSDSKELYTRTFRVSPDFISNPDSVSTHDEVSDNSKRKTAQEILEEAGINFPEGTWARTGGPVSQILVRNTTENLDKVQQYVKWMERECAPVRVAVTAQVLEAPGPLVRELTAGIGGRCDHRPELEKLLAAVREGKARHLGLSRVEARAGATGKTEQGVQHPYLTGTVDTDVRFVGSRSEVEPLGKAGSGTVGLKLAEEFHTAEPQERRAEIVDAKGRHLELTLTDFHLMKLAAETVVPDGAARMLAVWKPQGKQPWDSADVLQVMFITSDEVPATK